MCLQLKYLESKIADEDIICYKLVVRTKIKGVYKSSFPGFEYIIRQLYTNNIKIEFSHKLIKDRVLFGYSVEEGMFHSFINPYPGTLSSPLYSALLKCIIPKGTYYYEGKFNDFLSYASSQIKILEEI